MASLWSKGDMEFSGGAFNTTYILSEALQVKLKETYLKGSTNTS